MIGLQTKTRKPSRFKPQVPIPYDKYVPY